MKIPSLLLLLITTLFVPVTGACAGDALSQAMVYARQQRDGASAAVSSAQARVSAAAADLRFANEALADARRSGNMAAESVGQEAVQEAAAGVSDANTLLQRATTLLSTRNNALLRLQAQENAHADAPRALMLPGDGWVSRYDKNGNAVTDLLAPLQAGERVVTGANSTAKVFMAGGDAEATLSEKTEFSVLHDTPGEDFLADLRQGTLRLAAHVKAWSKRFEVRTPAAICGIRGTEFSLQTLPQGLHVTVYEGIVAVTPDSGETTEIKAGEQRDYLTGQGFGPVQSVKVDATGNLQDKEGRNNATTH